MGAERKTEGLENQKIQEIVLEEGKLEVNIQATQGVCSEFVDDKGRSKNVSIVVSPLKVTANEEQSKIVVQTGCNLWIACHNKGCYYSLASRQRKQ